MSRINTNVNAMIAQRILSQNNAQLAKSLERLSTGLAINRGSDNPAGLIASEKLRSEKAALATAISNAERAEQIANIAEGGLQEIQAALIELQSLVSETANNAGLSTEEKEANQLQVDNILATIDRIASTTSFAGVKLLNGSYDFTVTNQSASVVDYQINAAKIAIGSTLDVKVLVTASAQHGVLFLSMPDSALGLGASASGSMGLFVFEIAGAKGARQFSFASGTTLADMATNINTFKSVTGVSAVASDNYLILKSTEYGSDQYVSFKLIDSGGQEGGVVTATANDENTLASGSGVAFSSMTNPIKDVGQDIGAIINGQVARGRGKIASVASDALDVMIELDDTAAQSLANVDAFTIQDSGARFHLGPTIDIGNQVRLGIRNVATRNLGSKSLGWLSELGSGKTYNLISGNLETAQKIVNKAIDQVSQLRGRLGSFQKNIVGSTITALGITLENVSAAESVIRDTDMAKETANLMRSQILVQAATSALAIANTQGRSVLSLLS